MGVQCVMMCGCDVSGHCCLVYSRLFTYCSVFSQNLTLELKNFQINEKVVTVNILNIFVGIISCTAPPPDSVIQGPTGGFTRVRADGSDTSWDCAQD